jgi:crotonobetainyl-CoA:carnitine CoA-transferase CaiB-like acyl-CoA transferase
LHRTITQSSQNRLGDARTVDRCGDCAQDKSDLGGAPRPSPSDKDRTSMTTKVMQGVRILEVAQFTFTPAAGAILADWGADVIKVEHPVRGDTQRGFLNMGGVKLDPLRHTLIEHPNRGKRSVGIDLSTVEGQELLYELAKQCDVFLTNYLPQVRQKNRFDV